MARKKADNSAAASAEANLSKLRYATRTSGGGKTVGVSVRVPSRIIEQFKVLEEAALKHGFEVSVSSVCVTALQAAVREMANAMPKDLTGDLFSEFGASENADGNQNDDVSNDNDAEM